jgi:phytoene dehydrogenase-like protein
MTYEVIVVGGGIGGLTTAALLAARGVGVCLFERNEAVGGCVANFQHSGYTFEPTAGLYAGWEPGGVYERIFSELPVRPPEVHRVSPAYVVRLPDHADVFISDDITNFEQSLANAFPECAQLAINFYRKLVQVDHAASSAPEPLVKHLEGSSTRFRSFVDAQLRIFGQSSTERVSDVTAAAILLAPMHGLYAMRGGAHALANVLMESIKKSGGTIRLNSTVLRLAYGPDDLPIGVDLLNGERASATRTIVSNLTAWDTYGKLVGLKRTPTEISAQLKILRGWGAYLMFLAMDESARSRLTADRLLAVTGMQDDDRENQVESQFIFAAAPEWDRRAPPGKRAATICTLAEVDDWFTFHEDNAEHERMDQETLERWWAKLHAAMPELGNGIELIETATPRTYYETTRRRLGMVGTPQRDAGTPSPATYQTPFPNLFIVGDTVSRGGGLGSVSQSAEALAVILTL